METSTTSEHPKVTFLGGGNMATALISGLLTQGWPAGHFRVADKDAERRHFLAAELGIKTFSDVGHATEEAEVLVIAVKPQQLEDAIRALHVAPSTLVISVVAGTRIGTLQRAFGSDCVIVRAMPNTASIVRAGATGLYTENHDRDWVQPLATTLLNAVGVTYWVDKEDDLDIVTALSGSGPAYFLFLTETITQVAIDLGLPSEIAAGLARQTLIGSGRLLEGSSEQPEVLRNRITSKGGTTAAALNALESGGFRAIVETALRQAAARAAELGGLNDYAA